MAAGTVVWVSATKGHTFIAPDGGGRDLFVHLPAGAATTRLPLGAAVEFDVASGSQGRLFATNVVVANRSRA
jgi:CspA family cold shock protein